MGRTGRGHRLLSESGGRRLTQAHILTDLPALRGIGSVNFRKYAKLLVVGAGAQPANPMT